MGHVVQKGVPCDPPLDRPLINTLFTGLIEWLG